MLLETQRSSNGVHSLLGLRFCRFGEDLDRPDLSVIHAPMAPVVGTEG